MSELKEKKVRNTRKKRALSVMYNVDFGQLISDFIAMKPNYSKAQFCKDLGMSPTAVETRLKNPYYGTIYDLIDACIALRHDFISPIIGILKDNSIRLLALSELDQLKELKTENSALKDRITRLEKDNDVLHEYIKHIKSAS